MDNEKINELLDDAFNKLEGTPQKDSKLVNDMNSGLNWVLGLTTLSFTFYAKGFNGTLDCVDTAIVIMFAFITVLLVVYKYIFYKYEQEKARMYESFITHRYELKYNIEPLRTKVQNFIHKTDSRLLFTDFYNAFMNREFIPEYDHERKEDFNESERFIEKNGKVLKLIFKVSFVLFCLQFIGILALTLKESIIFN